MNDEKRFINFCNFQKYSNTIKNVPLHKLSFKKERNSLDISNTEIDSSLKKLTKKKEDSSSKKIYMNEIKELKLNNLNKSRYSKKIKIESKLTLPGTINLSNRKSNLQNMKKNSWLRQKNISCIYSDKNSDTKSDKESKKSCIILSTEPNKSNININSFLFKKNKIKNIPCKRLSYTKRDSSKNSRNLSIDYYNAFQCMFCEKIFKESEISKAILCPHKFCKRCGENFFYNLISDGYGSQRFKCPFIKCKKEIPNSVIESLLSSKNFDTLRINQMKQDKQDNETTYRNFINIEKESNKENIYNNSGNNSVKVRNDKIYNDKYIININNFKSEKFFYLQSTRIFLLCPKCGESTLYRNASKYFLKCLNCKNKFCKFCVKSLSDNHFDSDNIFRCKVHFRKDKFIKRKFYTLFIQQLFLTVAGYLFLMSYFINKMKILYRHKYKYLIIENIMIFFLYVILCFLFFPIVILLIPYYPIISCF